jgi:hypothetical protein
LAKHGEFPGENTGGFHRENGGFELFSPANIGVTCKHWGFGELKSSITTWHGDIRDMIGLERMAYQN